MKHIFRILRNTIFERMTCLFVVLLVLSTNSYSRAIISDSILPNLVFVYGADNTEGLGIAIGQRNDLVYVLTPYHVVKDSCIGIKSYNHSYQWSNITIARVDQEHDIACVVFKAPEFNLESIAVDYSFERNSTDWNTTIIYAKAQESETIEVYNELKLTKFGTDFSFIVQDGSFRMAGGSSGGVVNSEKGIIGMVTDVNTPNVTCLSINIIMNFIEKNQLIRTALRKAPVVPKSFSGYVFVEGGKFMMGCTGEQGSSCNNNNDSPAHEVVVNDYFIGQSEVTNEAYCRFLNAVGNRVEGGIEYIQIGATAGDKCHIVMQGNTYIVDQGYEQYPVVYISWYGAKAYCEWLSSISKTSEVYRLPTEAEWEYAARGGNKSMHYKYPGGSEANQLFKLGNFCDYQCAEEWKNRMQDDGYPFVAPVKKFRPNELNLYDMAGNVHEWCFDWYNAEYYRVKNVFYNPVGTQIGVEKVFRGGGWNSDLETTKIAYRHHLDPGFRLATIGFRVVICTY